ncbi:hypothetical protein [Sphingomonas sp. R86521]
MNPLEPQDVTPEIDREHVDAAIDEAEEESFPASDPPSGSRFD